MKSTFADPQAALAAYGAEDPRDAYVNQVLAGVAKQNQQQIADRALMQSMPAPMQAPDPRAAIEAYNGRNARAMQDQALGGMSSAIDERKLAADALAASRAETADARERLSSSAGVDSAMAGEEAVMAREEYQTAADKVQQEQRDDAEFIRTYEPKDRRTTGQRVMGAFALVLAGAADGATNSGGGQGNAVESVSRIINAGIDRDLEMQREMVNNRKTALAAKNTELGQMRERYGDEVNAANMARVMMLDQYQRELDAIVANGASQEAAAVAADTKGQLELQKQQLMADVAGTRLKEEQARAAAAARANKPKALDFGSLDTETLKALHAAGKLPDDVYKKSSFYQPPKDPAAVAGKLTEGQQKLDIQVAGAESAYNRLAPQAFKPDGSPIDFEKDKPDLPSYGVTRGDWLPDSVIPEENLQYKRDTLAMLSAVMRGESGANIPPVEVENKAYAQGLFSTDEALRLKGLQSLISQYRAMDVGKRLDTAPASARPPPPTAEQLAASSKVRKK